MSKIEEIIELSEKLNKDSDALINKVSEAIFFASQGAISPFIFGITIFILSCFIGYFVVWRVTPALHTPLMAVTNAISGVIIVGAIIALGSTKAISFVAIISFFAIIISSINIFGGFFITHRMLSMFKK